MNENENKNKAPAARPTSQKVSGSGNCESCEFYDYDEEYDAYICLCNLDEDEMASFLSRNTGRCPYYRYYDEYKSVRKQN